MKKYFTSHTRRAETRYFIQHTRRGEEEVFYLTYTRWGEKEVFYLTVYCALLPSTFARLYARAYLCACVLLFFARFLSQPQERLRLAYNTFDLTDPSKPV